MKFRTRSGTLVATQFRRIVHGGRGDYVEFHESDLILTAFYIPEQAKWRLDPFWAERAYYAEYRSQDPSYTKMYYQYKPVTDADYKPGLFYIAVADLVFENEPEPDWRKSSADYREDYE